jgi:hypothetical protein
LFGTVSFQISFGDFLSASTAHEAIPRSPIKFLFMLSTQYEKRPFGSKRQAGQSTASSWVCLDVGILAQK